MLFKKTKNNGTISAGTYEMSEGQGINIAVFNKATVAAFEENADGKLRLLINNDAVNRLGVDVVHTNDLWKPIQEAPIVGNPKIATAIDRWNKAAEKIGAKVEVLANFIDDEHLDCFWYGGSLAKITFKNGWAVLFEVNGEVRLHGIDDNGVDIEYVNKRNNGARYDDVFTQIANDDRLYALADSGQIEFGNNNWVEYNFIDPNGAFHDIGFCTDNVCSDNVLDAIDGFEELESAVEEYAKTAEA